MKTDAKAAEAGREERECRRTDAIPSAFFFFTDRGRSSAERRAA
jgi:hypothetical protein